MEEMRERLRLTWAALDNEIEAKMAVADAELARVGVNIASADENVARLLDYARELFCKAEFNFDGRGEQYMAKFEGVRDAMKLTGACTEQSGERSAESGDASEMAGEEP